MAKGRLAEPWHSRTSDQHERGGARACASKHTRSLKAGFEAQRACIRIGAAFLNQLATTKRTSRPSISRPLGYRVPVAAARCYYRRGARACLSSSNFGTLFAGKPKHAAVYFLPTKWLHPSSFFGRPPTANTAERESPIYLKPLGQLFPCHHGTPIGDPSFELDSRIRGCSYGSPNDIFKARKTSEHADAKLGESNLFSRQGMGAACAW